MHCCCGNVKRVKRVQGFKVQQFNKSERSDFSELSDFSDRVLGFNNSTIQQFNSAINYYAILRNAKLRNFV